MPRKPTEGFTELELDIMNILWENDEASSDLIRQMLPGDEKRKDSTVRTILGIMEKKEYVAHKTKGRTFIYYPLVPKGTAQKNALQKLTDKIFGGSSKLVMQCLVDNAELDDKTAASIKELLQK